MSSLGENPTDEVLDLLERRYGGDFGQLTLQWAVKDTFISYLRAMPDSSFNLIDGVVEAEDASGWCFPYVSHCKVRDVLEIRFSGQLRMSAHGGALLVIFMDPFLEVSPRGVSLSVVDLMHWPDTSFREVLGSGPLPANDLGNGELVFDLRLANSAVETFNNVYPAGTPLAPLSLSKN